MLKVAASLGSGTWSSAGALPCSCHADQPIMARPVAPTGWPLAISPPEVLMPHSPVASALPSAQ